MNSAEALTLLQLEPGASEKQIRSQLFRHYQLLTANLAALDDERQRPMLERQIDRLNQARDLLLAQTPATDPQPNAPSLALVSPDDLPDQVMVLLYRQGGQEGICTRQIQGQDIVLTFESMFAARKYAQRLEQQGLGKPWVERFDSQEIMEFCQASGYGMVVIPADQTLEPLSEATSAAQDWGSS
ncbi:MAG: DUF3110 domain-containing protein [Cyanobacteriota bacterium]|nr:DUF3110 domain-containing protein [Cyanobacteriota bacterium]